jgi:hypothetical protein
MRMRPEIHANSGAEDRCKMREAASEERALQPPNIPNYANYAPSGKGGSSLTFIAPESG